MLIRSAIVPETGSSNRPLESERTRFVTVTPNLLLLVFIRVLYHLNPAKTTIAVYSLLPVTASCQNKIKTASEPRNSKTNNESPYCFATA